MSDPLFTAGEVAAHFAVKPGTILDWTAAGKIPLEAVVRLGGTPHGRLRFRLDVIEEAWAEPASQPSLRADRGVG